MKEKLKKEGSILKLSVIFSAIYMLLEMIITFLSGSKTILMDCIFGIADLIIIVIITFLLPLIYKPVTEKRPYGYSQIESLIIIIKGISISIITLFLIKDNIVILLNGGSKLNVSSILISNVLLEIFCILSYIYLKHRSRKIDTPVIESDLVEWKIDMYTAFSMFVAFFIQYILEHTKFAFVAPYIDSSFAIIISLIMLKEPIQMVIESFKSLILFAPKEETIDEIKEIVSKNIEKYPYNITFYDVVKTGRKIWIELYIKSENSLINLKELKQAKKDVEKDLKNEFDEIYVEFTPEI